MDSNLTGRVAWWWKLRTHCTLGSENGYSFLIKWHFLAWSHIERLMGHARPGLWHDNPGRGPAGPAGPAHALYTQHHVVSEHEYQLGTVTWFFQWLHLAWHRPSPRHKHLRCNKNIKISTVNAQVPFLCCPLWQRQKHYLITFFLAKFQKVKLLFWKIGYSSILIIGTRTTQAKHRN